MRSVAPNCLANSNLFGLISTATMEEAPEISAAWMTFKPTPPHPNTTTELPACTLAELTTEP